MNENIEIWKDIEGYEGKYQVSNMGRVRSLDMEVTTKHPKSGEPIAYHQDGRLLQLIDHKGYRRVSFTTGSRDTKRYYFVHRLVARAFVDGWFRGAQVNHKNEQRDDNRAVNLEWVTAKENINHGRHNARMSETKGQRVVQYTMDGEKVGEFPSLTEAANQTGIQRENIGKCCNHADGYLSAGGFRWEFYGNEVLLTEPKRTGRAVIQIDRDGKEVARYDSVTEAAEATGAKKSLISRVAGTKYRAKGFLWRYADE